MCVLMRERIRASAEQSGLLQRGASAAGPGSTLAEKKAISSPGGSQGWPEKASGGKD